MAHIFQDTQKNSLLSNILKQAKQHLAIDQLLKTCLDKNLQSHCHVAQLQEDILIVHVNNSTWLPHLNYRTPEILQTLKSHPTLATLKKIQWKVRPPL